MTKTKLSPIALGLALGVLWGVSLLLLCLLNHFGYEVAFVSSPHAVVGYDFSIIGSCIAALIGFVDGFVRGAILGLLYNCFAGCCCKKGAKCD